ncbi:MAG: hypothetical protein IIC93_10025 [Chloroflexi bacterium]|nr:hypothetical protein [Chloroflexota bacterium]
MAGGIFFIFIARVYLLGPPDDLRTCDATSPLYAKLSLSEVSRKYHWIMEQLVEERMKLYEGETVLLCEKEKMAKVIPAGTFASKLAPAFAPHIPDPPNFTYAHFEELLYEHWRTYDCHLFNQSPDAPERTQARQAFYRLLTVLRPSDPHNQLMSMIAETGVLKVRD